MEYIEVAMATDDKVVVKRWPAAIIAALIAAMITASLTLGIRAFEDREEVLGRLNLAELRGETNSAAIDRITKGIEGNQLVQADILRELKAIRIGLAAKGVKVEVEK